MISRGRFRYIRSLYRFPINVVISITDLSSVLHTPSRDGMPWVMLTTEQGPEPITNSDLSDWIVDVSPEELEDLKHSRDTFMHSGEIDLDVTRTYPTEMKVLDEENFDRLVTEMAKGGYYEGRRKLDSEVDFVTITRPSPSSEYLEFKRSKEPPVLDSDQYFPAVDQAAKIMVDNMTTLHGETVELVDGIWRRKRPDGSYNPLDDLRPMDFTNGGRADRRMGNPGESHRRDSDPIDGGYVPPPPVLYHD